MVDESPYLPSFFPTGSSYLTPTHQPGLKSVCPNMKANISSFIVLVFIRNISFLSYQRNGLLARDLKLVVQQAYLTQMMRRIFNEFFFSSFFFFFRKWVSIGCLDILLDFWLISIKTTTSFINADFCFSNKLIHSLEMVYYMYTAGTVSAFTHVDKTAIRFRT